MGGGGDFTIIMIRNLHWLPLSNLDLIFPPIDVSVFFYYKKAHQSVNGGDDLPLGPWSGF